MTEDDIRKFYDQQYEKITESYYSIHNKIIKDFNEFMYFTMSLCIISLIISTYVLINMQW